VTDGGGKVAAALNTIDGVDRAARFLVGAARTGGATTAFERCTSCAIPKSCGT